MFFLLNTTTAFQPSFSKAKFALKLCNPDPSLGAMGGGQFMCFVEHQGWILLASLASYERRKSRAEWSWSRVLANHVGT